jgi:hypothetical protein
MDIAGVFDWFALESVGIAEQTTTRGSARYFSSWRFLGRPPRDRK